MEKRTRNMGGFLIVLSIIPVILFFSIRANLNSTQSLVGPILEPCAIYREVGTYSEELTNETMISLSVDYYNSIGLNITEHDLEIKRTGEDLEVIIIHNQEYRLQWCHTSDEMLDPIKCVGMLKFKNNKILKGFINPC